MTDQAADYAWWHNALARKAAGHKRDLGPINDGFPECGRYRRRRKGQTPSAVAIWRNEAGELAAIETIAMNGGTANRDVDPVEEWTWVCKDPITADLYQAFYDTGRWPDMDEAVADQVAAGIGHNEPLDELEALKDQIESAKAGIAAYEKIGDDETLAKAQSLRARLNELSGEADKKRKAEKEPHFEAGKAVDAKWQPLVKGAKEAADTVAKAMNAYQTAKLQRQREEERKAEEARKAAEQAAREAEAAGAPPTAPQPQPAPAPAPASPATQIKGGYGRAASTRLVQVVTEITDPMALAEYLKDHPDFRKTMLDLAQRAVNSGRTDVPGVKVEEQARVA